MKRAVCFIIGLGYLLLLSGPAFAECDVVPNGTTILAPETRAAGTVIYNSDYEVLQVCDEDGGWQALGPVGEGPSDPCDGSPTPGTTCGDGTIYVGLSPDGDVPMYTTATDASSGIPWNNDNGSGTRVATNQTSPITGESNTANLITIDSDSSDVGDQPHRAAQLCAEMTAYGHSDWYLPAKDELELIWEMMDTHGVSGFDASYYWSSTEDDMDTAWVRSFHGFGTATAFKQGDYPVRCVRR